MAKSYTRRINLYINGQAVKNDIKSISAEYRKSLNTIKTLERGTKEYHAEARKIKQLKSVISEHNNGLRTTGMNLRDVKIKALAAVAAITAVFRGLTNMMKGADQRQKQNDALLFALNQQLDVQRRLIREAERLQNITGHDDDEIKSMMVFLALQNRSETQIVRTTQAAIELSRVMNIGLVQAVQYLDGTMEGQIGRLGRLDEGFKTLTIEQLKNGQAIDLVLQKYGGLSEQAFKQGLGPLQKYGNAIGDLRKSIGEFFINAMMPFFSRLADNVNRINSTIARLTASAKANFSDQMDTVVRLTTHILPLADRYDTLSTKTNLNAFEHEELNTIIQEIARNMPTAISKFDNYGEAIEINTERLRQHIHMEKLYLQRINRSAIAETQKDIEKTESQLRRIAPFIEQIEKSGTYRYEVSGSFFAPHQTQDQASRWRTATNDMVSETVGKFQQLNDELRGQQIELERLSGDYLEQAIEARKEEAEAAETSKSGIEEVATAYETLSKQIAEARKEMEAFVSAGQFDQAKQTSLGIAALEAQKLVFDGILKNGGDVLAFLDNMTDHEEALLSETAAFNKEFLNEFSDIFDEIAEKRQRHREEEMAREDRRRELELEKERRAKDQKLQYEKDVAKAKEEITDAALYHGFSLLSQYMDRGYQRQILSLDLRRNAELSNENLTHEERQKIIERYQKKEATLKEQAFKRQRRADIIQSVINGYLAVSRALAAAPGWPLNAPNVITAGILAAIQTGSIAAQPVPQYVAGKYDVIGADDKRKYRARYIGKPKTGIVRTPSLISELGPEMIIDSHTLARLNPDIIRSIHAARFTPQYREGNYKAIGKKEPTGNDLSFIEKFSDSVNHFSNKVDELKDLQIEAYISYQRFKEFEKKVDQSEKNQF